MKAVVKLAAVLLVAAVSAGCAPTQQFIQRADESKRDPSKALIHVQRTAGVFGSGRSVSVEDGGKVVGEVANGDALVWERPPGPMRLSLTQSFGVVRGDSPPVIQDVKAGTVNRFVIDWTWSENSFVVKPAGAK